MTDGELSVFRHDSLHYGRQALEEIERLRAENEQLRARLDEAVMLLHKAAFRLVPIHPYDQIKAFLDRIDA